MKARITIIAALLAAGLFSSVGNSQTLEDLGAKFEQRCQELKQEKAKIQQAAQSPAASPEKKEQAKKAAAELDQVITATEKILKDPALKTDPEKREAAYARAQSAITYGNAVVASAHSGLGQPPSSAIERTVKSHLEDFTMKVSRGFDGSKTNTNDVSAPYVGSGTAFFRSGGNSSAPVSVNATYTPTTPKAAQENTNKYGSAGGGILLEDAAGGLGRISAVKYDGRYNALVMDDHLVYFLKVPSWDAAALCRDIARDKDMRVGVSMGKTSLVYGERSTYENTAVGHNLLLTDHFLGDFVFGEHKWSKGYNFPNGYEPQTTIVTADMLVQFVFKGFQFAAKNNEIQLTNLSLDVRFMPVAKEPAPDGGMLPDLDVLNRGYEPPPAFLANAQYLTSHFEFFRHERIVAKTIAYGELAALFRSYKQAGVNLETLASAMDRG